MNSIILTETQFKILTKSLTTKMISEGYKMEEITTDESHEAHEAHSSEHKALRVAIKAMDEFLSEGYHMSEDEMPIAPDYPSLYKAISKELKGVKASVYGKIIMASMGVLTSTGGAAVVSKLGLDPIFLAGVIAAGLGLLSVGLVQAIKTHIKAKGLESKLREIKMLFKQSQR